MIIRNKNRHFTQNCKLRAGTACLIFTLSTLLCGILAAQENEPPTPEHDPDAFPDASDNNSSSTSPKKEKKVLRIEVVSIIEDRSYPSHLGQKQKLQPPVYAGTYTPHGGAPKAKSGEKAPALRQRYKITRRRGRFGKGYRISSAVLMGAGGGVAGFALLYGFVGLERWKDDSVFKEAAPFLATGGLAFCVGAGMRIYMSKKKSRSPVRQIGLTPSITDRYAGLNGSVSF